MEAAPGPVTGRGRAGGSRAGVRAASRVGPGVTHGAGPGGSLSASTSSPSPSSAAAASGCSLGPRGAAPALGPSVVFRPLLSGDRIPRRRRRRCAGGRRPRGSRGGRAMLRALARSGCGCGSVAGPGNAFAFARLPQIQSLPAAPLPAPSPSPALTCALRSRRGRDVGRRRNAPFGLGRPRAAGRTQDVGVRAEAEALAGAEKSGSRGGEFLSFQPATYKVTKNYKLVTWIPIGTPDCLAAGPSPQNLKELSELKPSDLASTLKV
nr:uncharacterized protein LOC116152964 [Camelus dromedarius]